MKIGRNKSVTLKSAFEVKIRLITADVAWYCLTNGDGLLGERRGVNRGDLNGILCFNEAPLRCGVCLCRTGVVAALDSDDVSLYKEESIS